MNLQEIKALVRPEDVQASLEPQFLHTLTDGDSTVLEKAISSACIWLYSVLKRCQIEDLAETELLREALIKRSIYELFSRSEVEVSAEDKKQEAELLLISIFGDCVSMKSKITSGAIAYDPKLFESTSEPSFE